ncbi:MAG: hypothetical protein MHM6MM_007382 [Cercozoa sp. M6MM]
MDSRRREYDSKITKLAAFLVESNLSTELEGRVRRHFEALWGERSSHAADSAKFMEQMPVELKSEVGLRLHSETISLMPFFAHADENFISNVVQEFQMKKLSGNWIIFYVWVDKCSLFEF